MKKKLIKFSHKINHKTELSEQKKTSSHHHLFYYLIDLFMFVYTKKNIKKNTKAKYTRIHHLACKVIQNI